MNINELFEIIQDKFLPEDLIGEFQLQGNCITWTYNLENDSEEIPIPINNEDDEELQFDSLSSEELLLEAYDADILKLEELLDEIEESDNWTFSESETNENIISFKIF
jgi:hypothetical protein